MPVLDGYAACAWCKFQTPKVVVKKVQDRILMEFTNARLLVEHYETAHKG